MTQLNVIHFGSHGLRYIIETAKRLKDMDDDSIRFIFLSKRGDGAKIACPNRAVWAGQYGYTWAKQRDVLAEVVNCCKASITSFLNLPVLQTNSHNMLFDLLSAGRTIIVNSADWTKGLVEKEDYGFFCDSDSSHDLADMLCRYQTNEDTLKRFGENVRRLSVEIFDKDIHLCRPSC